ARTRRRGPSRDVPWRRTAAGSAPGASTHVQDDDRAAVLTPSLGRAVVTHGVGGATTLGRDARAVDVVTLHQVLLHRIGALLRDLGLRSIRALVVGVADDRGAHRRVLLHPQGDLVEARLADVVQTRAGVERALDPL